MSRVAGQELTIWGILLKMHENKLQGRRAEISQAAPRHVRRREGRIRKELANSHKAFCYW